MSNTKLMWFYDNGVDALREYARVFAGEVTANELLQFIAHMPDDEFMAYQVRFIAYQVGLPEVVRDNPMVDHVWVTFDGLSSVSESPTDPRDIHEFVREFCATPWDEEAAIEELMSVEFEGCACLDFSDKYANCVKVATQDVVCWDRLLERDLVQFCTKRGRLRGPLCCIGKSRAQCSAYQAHTHYVPFKKINWS